MDSEETITVASYKSIHFGVDIIEGALNHLQFLKNINKHRNLFHVPLLRRALRRYEQLWLDLAAEHNEKVLTAPLDIEWIWHCHMLSPICYEKDCKNLVGKTVNHVIVKDKERQKHLEITKKLWEAKYPDTPFEINIDQNEDESPEEERDSVDMWESKLTYDVVSAAIRQSAFNYQVSLPHYYDKYFLRQAVKRYKKLLFLKVQHQGLFFVPCYDNDLIWHTHQLHPLVYKKDTERILGKMFNHDDSVNDRSSGSRLLRAESKTKQFWQEAYNESFSRNGAMYRGDPPIGQLHRLSSSDVMSFSTKRANIKLDNIQIENLPEIIKSYKLKVQYVSNDKEGPVILNFKGLPSHWDKKKGIEFEFDTKDYNYLKFKLIHQPKRMCFSATIETAEAKFHVLPLAESNTGCDTELSETLVLNEEKNITLNFNGNIHVYDKPGPCFLFLKNGNFDRRYCIMPENIRQLWGPIPLPRLPAGQDNNCVVASHKFVNHMGEMTFTCRVIHSIPLLMSAIQVFYHDKMATVAHLIGPEQLPCSTEVSDPKSCPSLNSKQGQRALLIKTEEGDWGILIGQWTGFRRGKPGTRAQKGLKGSPGTLTIRFFHIKSGHWNHLALPYLENLFKFNLGDSNVDLQNGVITISSENGEVAENLTMAFGVALLHVLCQPRKKLKKLGENTTPMRGMKLIRSIPSSDLGLVVAAGYSVEAPTNQFIRKLQLRNRNGPCSSKDDTEMVGYGMGVDFGDAIAEELGTEPMTEAQNTLEAPGEASAGDIGDTGAEVAAEAGGEAGACGGGCGGACGSCGGCGGCAG